MKHVSFFVLMIFVTNVIYAQNISDGGAQFSNNGFEQWAFFDPSDSASNEPLNWHAYMSAYGEYNPLQNAKYQQIWPSEHVRPGSSGLLAAKITARDVLGVLTANGGITNGRIHVGSTSVGDTTNYNISLRNNEIFNTPLGMFPDSLTVWVAFFCEYNNQQARIRAIVHGDADFNERADGSLRPQNKYVGEALDYFIRTNAITDSLNYHWRRLSIPFIYNGPCNDPRYVLFTMGTNKIAGQGLGNEYIVLDDILLIYNPSLTIDYDNHSTIVLSDSGTSVDIPFTITGTMSPSNLNVPVNIVTAQLSDSTGNFDNAINIGHLQSDKSGVISAIVPTDVPCGKGYRIRVTSTNYPLVSQDNGFDIKIDSIEGIRKYGHKINVYPSVTKNIVKIVADTHINFVSVYNISGEKVDEITCQSNDSNCLIDMSRYVNGMYLLYISVDNQQYLFKVQKQ